MNVVLIFDIYPRLPSFSSSPSHSHTTTDRSETHSSVAIVCRIGSVRLVASAVAAAPAPACHGVIEGSHRS